jgi:transketolase
VKIINGHNVNQIYKSLLKKDNNKPTVIIANTVKGKGVSFFENKVLWHYRSPNKTELKLAMKELA